VKKLFCHIKKKCFFCFTCNIHFNIYEKKHYLKLGGRRGRDRMVVGFTTTYAISAYHH